MAPSSSPQPPHPHPRTVERPFVSWRAPRAEPANRLHKEPSRLAAASSNAARSRAIQPSCCPPAHQRAIAPPAGARGDRGEFDAGALLPRQTQDIFDTTGMTGHAEPWFTAAAEGSDDAVVAMTVRAVSLKGCQQLGICT